MKTVRDWKLYVITDPDLSDGRPCVEVVRQAIQGGADVIQLRDKSASGSALWQQAVALMKLTRNLDIPLIINDRIDLALAVDADGVHLGQDDLPVSAARRLLGPQKTIGLSTHSLQQALAAEQEEIDYLSVGPLFPTMTKADVQAVGLDLLRHVRGEVTKPIVGIGGVNEANITEVRKAGADIFAVVSAVVAADDIDAAARSLKAKIMS